MKISIATVQNNPLYYHANNTKSTNKDFLLRKSKNVCFGLNNASVFTRPQILTGLKKAFIAFLAIFGLDKIHHTDVAPKNTVNPDKTMTPSKEEICPFNWGAFFGKDLEKE